VTGPVSFCQLIVQREVNKSWGLRRTKSTHPQQVGKSSSPLRAPFSRTASNPRTPYS
jgi:hypothetical protein